MILNTGENWEPEQADIDKWTELYPAVSVEQELRAMAGWLDANPSKRKTSRGIKRFCNAWLSRSQDKGGSPQAKAAGGKITRTRDMSSMMELTHNFTGEPAMRQHFINKFGECFEDGVRHTS